MQRRSPRGQRSSPKPESFPVRSRSPRQRPGLDSTHEHQRDQLPQQSGGEIEIDKSRVLKAIEMLGKSFAGSPLPANVVEQLNASLKTVERAVRKYGRSIVSTSDISQDFWTHWAEFKSVFMKLNTDDNSQAMIAFYQDQIRKASYSFEIAEEIVNFQDDSFAELHDLFAQMKDSLITTEETNSFGPSMRLVRSLHNFMDVTVAPFFANVKTNRFAYALQCVERVLTSMRGLVATRKVQRQLREDFDMTQKRMEALIPQIQRHERSKSVGKVARDRPEQNVKATSPKSRRDMFSIARRGFMSSEEEQKETDVTRMRSSSVRQETRKKQEQLSPRQHRVAIKESSNPDEQRGRSRTIGPENKGRRHTFVLTKDQAEKKLERESPSKRANVEQVEVVKERRRHRSEAHKNAEYLEAQHEHRHRKIDPEVDHRKTPPQEATQERRRRRTHKEQEVTKHQDKEEQNQTGHDVKDGIPEDTEPLDSLYEINIPKKPRFPLFLDEQEVRPSDLEALRRTYKDMGTQPEQTEEEETVEPVIDEPIDETHKIEIAPVEEEDEAPKEAEIVCEEEELEPVPPPVVKPALYASDLQVIFDEGRLEESEESSDEVSDERNPSECTSTVVVSIPSRETMKETHKNELELSQPISRDIDMNHMRSISEPTGEFDIEELRPEIIVSEPVSTATLNRETELAAVDVSEPVYHSAPNEIEDTSSSPAIPSDSVEPEVEVTDGDDWKPPEVISSIPIDTDSWSEMPQLTPTIDEISRITNVKSQSSSSSEESAKEEPHEVPMPDGSTVGFALESLDIASHPVHAPERVPEVERKEDPVSEPDAHESAQEVASAVFDSPVEEWRASSAQESVSGAPETVDDTAPPPVSQGDERGWSEVEWSTDGAGLSVPEPEKHHSPQKNVTMFTSSDSSEPEAVEEKEPKKPQPEELVSESEGGTLQPTKLYSSSDSELAEEVLFATPEAKKESEHKRKVTDVANEEEDVEWIEEEEEEEEEAKEEKKVESDSSWGLVVAKDRHVECTESEWDPVPTVPVLEKAMESESFSTAVSLLPRGAKESSAGNAKGDRQEVDGSDEEMGIRPQVKYADLQFSSDSSWGLSKGRARKGKRTVEESSEKNEDDAPRGRERVKEGESKTVEVPVSLDVTESGEGGWERSRSVSESDASTKLSREEVNGEAAKHAEVPASLDVTEGVAVDLNVTESGDAVWERSSSESADEVPKEELHEDVPKPVEPPLDLNVSESGDAVFEGLKSASESDTSKKLPTEESHEEVVKPVEAPLDLNVTESGDAVWERSSSESAEEIPKKVAEEEANEDVPKTAEVPALHVSESGEGLWNRSRSESADEIPKELPDEDADGKVSEPVEIPVDLNVSESGDAVWERSRSASESDPSKKRPHAGVDEEGSKPDEVPHVSRRSRSGSDVDTSRKFSIEDSHEKAAKPIEPAFDLNVTESGDDVWERSRSESADEVPKEESREDVPIPVEPAFDLNVTESGDAVWERSRSADEIPKEVPKEEPHEDVPKPGEPPLDLNVSESGDAVWERSRSASESDPSKKHPHAEVDDETSKPDEVPAVPPVGESGDVLLDRPKSDSESDVPKKHGGEDKIPKPSLHESGDAGWERSTSESTDAFLKKTPEDDVDERSIRLDIVDSAGDHEPTHSSSVEKPRGSLFDSKEHVDEVHANSELASVPKKDERSSVGVPSPVPPLRFDREDESSDDFGRFHDSAKREEEELPSDKPLEFPDTERDKPKNFQFLVDTSPSKRVELEKNHVQFDSSDSSWGLSLRDSSRRRSSMCGDEIEHKSIRRRPSSILELSSSTDENPEIPMFGNWSSDDEASKKPSTKPLSGDKAKERETVPQVTKKSASSSSSSEAFEVLKRAPSKSSDSEKDDVKRRGMMDSPQGRQHAVSRGVKEETGAESDGGRPELKVTSRGGSGGEGDGVPLREKPRVSAPELHFSSESSDENVGRGIDLSGIRPAKPKDIESPVHKKRVSSESSDEKPGRRIRHRKAEAVESPVHKKRVSSESSDEKLGRGIRPPKPEVIESPVHERRVSNESSDEKPGRGIRHRKPEVVESPVHKKRVSSESSDEKVGRGIDLSGIRPPEPEDAESPVHKKRVSSESSDEKPGRRIRHRKAEAVESPVHIKRVSSESSDEKVGRGIDLSGIRPPEPEDAESPVHKKRVSSESSDETPGHAPRLARVLPPVPDFADDGGQTNHRAPKGLVPLPSAPHLEPLLPPSTPPDSPEPPDLIKPPPLPIPEPEDSSWRMSNRSLPTARSADNNDTSESDFVPQVDNYDDSQFDAASIPGLESDLLDETNPSSSSTDSPENPDSEITTPGQIPKQLSRPNLLTNDGEYNSVASKQMILLRDRNHALQARLVKKRKANAEKLRSILTFLQNRNTELRAEQREKMEALARAKSELEAIDRSRPDISDPAYVETTLTECRQAEFDAEKSVKRVRSRSLSKYKRSLRHEIKALQRRRSRLERKRMHILKKLQTVKAPVKLLVRQYRELKTQLPDYIRMRKEMVVKTQKLKKQTQRFQRMTVDKRLQSLPQRRKLDGQFLESTKEAQASITNLESQLSEYLAMGNREKVLLRKYAAVVSQSNFYRIPIQRFVNIENSSAEETRLRVFLEEVPKCSTSVLSSLGGSTKEMSQKKRFRRLQSKVKRLVGEASKSEHDPEEVARKNARLKQELAEIRARNAEKEKILGGAKKRAMSEHLNHISSEVSRMKSAKKDAQHELEMIRNQTLLVDELKAAEEVTNYRRIEKALKKSRSQIQHILAKPIARVPYGEEYLESIRRATDALHDEYREVRRQKKEFSMAPPESRIEQLHEEYRRLRRMLPSYITRRKELVLEIKKMKKTQERMKKLSADEAALRENPHVRDLDGEELILAQQNQAYVTWLEQIDEHFSVAGASYLESLRRYEQVISEVLPEDMYRIPLVLGERLEELCVSQYYYGNFAGDVWNRIRECLTAIGESVVSDGGDIPLAECFARLNAHVDALALTNM